MKEFMRAVKFTLFSISAGIIQIVSAELMLQVFHIDYWISYLTSLVLSIIWNFTLNRKVTFHSANNIPIAMLKVFAYYVVFTPLSTIGGNYLVNIGWNETVVLVLSMLLNFITEFLFYRFVVFGKSIDTAKKQQKSRF